MRDEDRRQIIEGCSRSLEALRGLTGADLTAAMRDAFERHDLVWACWPDASQPGGAGVLLCKGAGLLQRSTRERRNVTARRGYLPTLTCAAEALAVQQT